MKLLYVPPLGGGIRDLFEAGQHRRLFENYFEKYSAEFDEVLMLSFFDEQLSDYKDLKIPARVRLLPNKFKLHRYLYAALAPLLYWRETRGLSVVRVSQTTGALPAFFFKLLRGFPRVIITYGYDYVLFARGRGQAAALLAKLHEAFGRLTADFWITTTPDLINHLKTRHHVDADKIFLIPNGVDLGLFPEPGAPDTAELRSLVFVGRLEAQKNLFFLIDCVSAAAERMQRSLKLTLIGDGSLAGTLRAYPRSAGLDLEFAGKVEQSRLAAVLRQAQLFVIASHYEGHPKAVLDAMAAGLPVLGKDAPGVTRLLRDSGQSIFESVDSFVDKLEALSDTRTRQTAAKQARSAVVARFDLQKNLAQETGILLKLGRKEL